MASKKALDLFKEISKMVRQKPGFHQFLNHIEFKDGAPGVCIAEFVVQEQDLNVGGILNGGLTATIISHFTTYALVSSGKSPGNATDLHISYFKPAFKGDTVIIDARTTKNGRNIVFLECELRNKASREMIAKGTHTKYISQSRPDEHSFVDRNRSKL